MFASMGAVIRVLSLDVDNELIVFFRNLFGLLILLPWWLYQGMDGLKTQHFSLHIIRSLAGLSAMYCFFYVLGHLPLSEAVLLNFSAPIFIPVIAFFWLAETVAFHVIGAIALGFIGIVLVLQPGYGLASPIAIIGMASGVFAAIAMVSLRKLSHSEPPARVVFFYSVICTIVSAIPLAWAWKMPSDLELLLLVLVGLLATSGQLLLTRAYRYAPAAQIGPFSFVSVLFAAGYGWWFWGEVSDWVSLVGTVLVVIAGIISLRRQKIAH